LDGLIDKIYPGISDLHLKTEGKIIQYFSERVILAPRNAEVNTINDAVQACLSGASKTYFSADVAVKEGGVIDEHMPQEYLNTVAIRVDVVRRVEKPVSQLLKGIFRRICNVRKSGYLMLGGE
jgi:PIF1-like helicase